jgi:flagellar biosynthesis/type III secretory pathway protein FliH
METKEKAYKKYYQSRIPDNKKSEEVEKAFEQGFTLGWTIGYKRGKESGFTEGEKSGISYERYGKFHEMGRC